MRDPVQRLAIDYDQERRRWATVTRDNIAAATKRAYDGEPIGLYRDGDDLIPIIARNVDVERERAAAELDVAQVQPALAPKSIPLGQVVSNIGLVWEDPILTRWDRHPQIAVQAAPVNGTFMTLRADVAEEIAAIDLPPGYSLSWDGEHKSIVEALVSLIPGIGPAVLITLVIMVALFNAVRPVIVIALALPYAIIGITGALLAANIPFGFMSVLGAMSLVGMLIKNAIVLIDEINLNQSQGASPYDAVVGAGVSRVRPVVLAALTTVLGVAPLLQDVFCVSMAITIMAGLTFGTSITMVLVPTLYATFDRVRSPRRADAATAPLETTPRDA
jgi:multidrug efflux pump subunit AcrB